MKLNIDQEKAIADFVDSYGLSIPTLRDDLLDHLCCVVESELGKGNRGFCSERLNGNPMANHFSAERKTDHDDENADVFRWLYWFIQSNRWAYFEPTPTANGFGIFHGRISNLFARFHSLACL